MVDFAPMNSTDQDLSIEQAGEDRPAPPAPPPLPTVAIGTARPIGRRLTLLWISPHDPPEACIQSWLRAHRPDDGWDVRVLTNRDGWLYQDAMEALWAHVAEPEWAVMEIAKLEVVSSVGGFVVSADSFCERALSAPSAAAPDKPQIDFFNMADALVGFENEGTRPGTIGSVFLGGVKNSEFFGRCLELAGKMFREAPMTSAGVGTFARFLGSPLLTQVYGEMIQERACREKKLLRALPARLFSPVDPRGAPAIGAHPVFARAQFASVKGMNHLRKWPCQCQKCRNTVQMIRPPWG